MHFAAECSRPTAVCRNIAPYIVLMKLKSEEEAAAGLAQCRRASFRDTASGVSYLSKAAILMGCSRQYIYKLVAQGRLRASRISNRMAFIRRADIEKMLEDNPYNRVIPGSRPKKAASTSSGRPESFS